MLCLVLDPEPLHALSVVHHLLRKARLPEVLDIQGMGDGGGSGLPHCCA